MVTNSKFKARKVTKVATPGTQPVSVADNVLSTSQVVPDLHGDQASPVHELPGPESPPSVSTSNRPKQYMTKTTSSNIN